MENKIKCVPQEFIDRVREFEKKLWDAKHPLSVELSSIFGEFEDEIIPFDELSSNISKDYKAKMEHLSDNYKEKIKEYEGELNEIREENNKFKKNIEDLKNKLSEAEILIKQKEEDIYKVRAEVSEEKSRLIKEFSIKAEELYENMRAKEEAMLKKWEEKNKILEQKMMSLEREYMKKIQELRLKEKMLNDDFNLRKKELIKTFDRMRIDLENREKMLFERENKVLELERKYAITSKRTDEENRRS